MKAILRSALTVALVITLLAGVGLGIYFVATNFVPATASAPAIAFDSVEVGEVVTVAVTARGDRVARAELWAGDRMIAREVNPNPALGSPWTVAWQWQPPAPGVYPLAARAFDESGRYGASSLFSVVIPPKSELLFSSDREGGHTLYKLETDTRATGLWQPPASDNRQPAVSAGKVVAFVSNKNNAWQLVTRAWDNPALTTLAPNLTTVQRPTWSEDGKKLAFEVTDAQGATNVVVSDADGKNQRTVTDTDGFDGQASFSPTGDQIAFTGRRGSESDIYSLALADGTLTRLTSDPAEDAQPAWSPDGTRIAFVSNRSGVAQLWVMPVPAAGSTAAENAVQLTNIPSGAEQPKWSPDGNWLAFVAYTGAGEGDDRRELYLLYAPAGAVNPDQRALIRLTQNDKDDTEPAWVTE